MHVAIPIYPTYTALDIVGPYTVLAFAPGWQVSFVAATEGPVLDDRGSLSLVVTATYDEVTQPDIVLVPGGNGTAQALGDPLLLDWLRTVHEHTAWTTSVCSGSLILGAAGLLEGLPASCHWGWRDLLRSFGAVPSDERVTVNAEHRIATAAGVSAGIDMALSLLGRTAGDDTARAVQLAIEYDPQPPYDSGSAATATEALRAAALALI
ncbi:DJ-1/PfpI family protein [Nocardia sp. NPDC004568]|uniref:DJ-1/PfpI family protein n=1 Tax=Nocardia sp. NPDC004568 TaxID=3154551 RepID=UPI0033AA724B